MHDRQRLGRLPRSSAAVLRYVGGWLIAGTLLAAALLFAIRGDDEADVALPPVREIELAEASRRAGCELSRDARAEHLRPPATGDASAPAPAPGVYERRPPVDALIAAVRAGIVVIHHRPDLGRERVAELTALQAAVPAGTIVTPNAEMPFAVAVTAWRRLLGCRRHTPEILDAIRLFRGRFIGSGPDVDAAA